MSDTSTRHNDRAVGVIVKGQDDTPRVNISAKSLARINVAFACVQGAVLFVVLYFFIPYMRDEAEKAAREQVERSMPTIELKALTIAETRIAREVALLRKDIETRANESKFLFEVILEQIKELKGK